MASASIESGTDAQTGVPNLRFSSNDAQVKIALGNESSASRSLGSAVGANISDSAPTSAPAMLSAPSLGGPQDAVAGGVVQVLVNNPDGQVLETQLSYDASVLQPAGAAAESGKLSIQVSANGLQAVSFTVKPQVSDCATTVTLNAGGSLTINLHPASSVSVPVVPK